MSVTLTFHNNYHTIFSLSYCSFDPISHLRPRFALFVAVSGFIFGLSPSCATNIGRTTPPSRKKSWSIASSLHKSFLGHPIYRIVLNGLALDLWPEQSLCAKKEDNSGQLTAIFNKGQIILNQDPI